MATSKNPFNPDGRSGAAGNTNRGQLELGPERAQQRGSGRNPASVPAGGPVLKIDPPSDRQGQIGSGTPSLERKPFAINRAFGNAPEPPSDDGDGSELAIAGEVPEADEGAD